MKNIATLLVAILITAGMSFAQNNDATVLQEVDDSEVNIDQMGSNNQASASQSLGNNNMFIEIDQNGTSNQADVAQQWGQWHWTYVDQIGAGNELKLIQDNTSTRVDVMQDGDGNYADIFHRNYLFSFNDYISSVFLKQDGDENEALIVSDGSGNTVNVLQAGENNDAHLTQSGDQNSADIRQGAVGGSNDSYVNLTQSGYKNSVDIRQIVSDNQSFTGSQSGDLHSFRLFSRGTGHVVTMDMDGDRNLSDWIIGDNLSEDNVLTLDVDGSRNHSGGSIQGSFNTVTLQQSGDYNRIGTSYLAKDGVVINGDYNTVDISQMGDSDAAFVTQMGNSNTATISQSN